MTLPEAARLSGVALAAIENFIAQGWLHVRVDARTGAPMLTTDCVPGLQRLAATHGVTIISGGLRTP